MNTPTDSFLLLADEDRIEVLTFEKALDDWRVSRSFLRSQLQACRGVDGIIDWEVYDASCELLRATHEEEVNLLILALGI